MSADGGSTRSAPVARATQESFELERFTWASPDRLELTGRFAGLADTPNAAPVLVIRGADRIHRLPAVPESSSAAPEDGRPWHVEFAWQEPPEPFTAAELELGDLAVSLPDPAAKRPQLGRERLPVHRPPPVDGARRVGLEAELLTVHEQLRELRVEGDRDREERERAQEALHAERARRAEDGERFREGVARVRGAAEEAVADEHATVVRISSELAEAVAERDALRERVAELEADAHQSSAALAGLVAARETAGAAGDDAERLLARLRTLRDALGAKN
jgi:hypothetical protein